jgi:hypothetical protein
MTSGDVVAPDGAAVGPRGLEARGYVRKVARRVETARRVVGEVVPERGDRQAAAVPERVPGRNLLTRVTAPGSATAL